jgi:hypothetical protein
VVLVYWHAFAGLILLPLHVVMAWRSRQAWLTWLLVSLVCFPWLVNMADGVGAGGLPSSWIPAPDLLTIVNIAADVPGAFGVGLALAVVGAFHVKGERRTLLVAWAGLPFAISLVVSLVNPVLLDRYLIVSCPAFALLGAVALAALPKRASVAAAIVTAAAIALALGLSYARDGSESWHGEDWRAATAFAMEQGGAVVNPAWATIAYDYYGGTRGDAWVIELRMPGESWEPACSIAFGDKLRVRPTSPTAECDLPQQR